ncbi:7-carboxy-7-deazaguanine synthase QueE [Pelistega europaea]|uniref:7-carboxy-7-deazaguanine synthase n=1 Tax=Pelistega europaea TaxID=106147 RepID=A0A7Y4P4X4_9BURK|nr:7-carboxy-7-deazaguanine synthase QueE [Pelistega europaea]NOL49153.1 7-carboxy-7-deazaguanine synthase QueE [Pelistega europaea]
MSNHKIISLRQEAEVSNQSGTSLVGELNPSFRIVEIFESLQGEGYNTGMPAIFIRLGRCSLACSWCDTDYLTYSVMTLQQILDAISGYTARNIIITGGEPSIHPHLDVLLTVLKQQGYFLCIESNALHEISPLIDYIAVSPKYCYSSRYTQHIIAKADEVRIVVDPMKTGLPPVTSATSSLSKIEKDAGEMQEKLSLAEQMTSANNEALQGLASQMVNADIEQEFINWCLWVTQHLKAKHYFLSPLEVNGEMNILQTIALVGHLNKQHYANPEKYPHWQLSIQTHKFAHIQ